MPIELGIWRLGAEPKKIEFSSMETEERLEEILTKDISILDPNLLLIGRQVLTDYGKLIDLLAIDREGKLVVIELKKDKTPRDVVAQVLDYGSWIRGLEDDDIAEIFVTFRKKYFSDAEPLSLDKAFFEKFNTQELPESLNESHELLIVAAHLDDSTERIINYLTDNGFAINAVFFRFFKDGDAEYLSRAWLIEPTEADVRTTETAQKLPWNGEFYVSFGHKDSGSRHWEDARKYGFVSAGGGEWYTRTLRMLEPGKRVWVNIPGGTGYVGVGIIEEGPVVPKDFMVTDDAGNRISIDKVDLKGNLNHPFDNSAGTDEYLVRVKWLHTVSIKEAVSEKGFFGNQNSAARPLAKKWRHTISRLKTIWGIAE
jgi:hypothetical protein